jgi:hypothetical protein
MLRPELAEDAAPTGLGDSLGLGNYEYVAPTELAANPFEMSKNRPRGTWQARTLSGQVDTLAHLRGF